VRYLSTLTPEPGDGSLSYDEFLNGLAAINVAPKKGEQIVFFTS
jgi:hypothetical protein